MLQLKTLTLGELIRHAGLWNDLWQQSAARFPTTRAEGIQLWCQWFTDSELKALVVVDGDRFVAGLPLIRDVSRWPLTVFRLPSNCTVGSGDLLVDPDCHVDAAVNLLAVEIGRLSGTIAAMEGIEIDSDRWQRLIAAFQQRGRQVHQSQGHEVGVVDILHDWDAYTRSWSRNHRSAIRRCRKKLEAEGKVEAERLQQGSNEELYQALEACYAIEDKGWKGDNGTSILRTSGLAEYYHQEARMMRDAGMLDLWMLRLDGRIIAFEYCHYAKATCFSHKISFDPEFDRFSPGRVLRSIQLEQYHQDPAAALLDTLGVLCQAKAKWVTRTYRSSRCYIALGGPAANCLLGGFKAGRGIAKFFRGADSDTHRIQPGAAKYLQMAAKAKACSDPPPGVPLTILPLCPPAASASEPSHSY